jgi:hypothetical protein
MTNAGSFKVLGSSWPKPQQTILGEVVFLAMFVYGNCSITLEAEREVCTDVE